jgi:hypothetical protein
MLEPIGASLDPEDAPSLFSLDVIKRLGSGVTVAGDAVEATVSGDFFNGLFDPCDGGGVASVAKDRRRAPAAKAADKA